MALALHAVTPEAAVAHGMAMIAGAAVARAHFVGVEQVPGRYYLTSVLPLTYLVLYGAYHLAGGKAMLAAGVACVLAFGAAHRREHNDMPR
jgi:hypothetical protein